MFDWLNNTHEIVKGDPVTGWELIAAWTLIFGLLPLGVILAIRAYLRHRRRREARGFEVVERGPEDGA